MPKKYNKFFLGVCSCVKYKSCLYMVLLKETRKSFLSLFQFCIIVTNVYCECLRFNDFDNAEKVQ